MGEEAAAPALGWSGRALMAGTKQTHGSLHGRNGGRKVADVQPERLRFQRTPVRKLSSTLAQPPPVLAYGFAKRLVHFDAAAHTTMAAFGSVSLVTAAVGFCIVVLGTR
jgi:hypothetical protein